MKLSLIKKTFTFIFLLAFSLNTLSQNCATPTNLQLQTAYDTQVWVEWDETSALGSSNSNSNSSASLISDCSDFVSGPSAWPYVLVATTIADGAASQGSQTFEMNVTSLPAGGANFRVFKTTANGSNFFGNPVALTLGVNTITVQL